MTSGVIDSANRAGIIGHAFGRRRSIGRSLPARRRTRTKGPAMSILPSPLLRQALLSDAVTSIACALLMFLGAGLLHTMLGLSASLLRSAGLILFLYAGLVAWLGMRTTLRRLAVLAVIV